MQGMQTLSWTRTAHPRLRCSRLHHVPNQAQPPEQVMACCGRPATALLFMQISEQRSVTSSHMPICCSAMLSSPFSKGPACQPSIGSTCSITCLTHMVCRFKSRRRQRQEASHPRWGFFQGQATLCSSFAGESLKGCVAKHLADLVCCHPWRPHSL